MARRMSEINKKTGKYFKTPDLEELTGRPWQTARINVTITRAYEGAYAASSNGPEEPAFFIELAGIAKPMGVNYTNRCVLEQMLGSDAEWDSAWLAGLRLTISAHMTNNGKVGLKLDPVADTAQAESAAARAKIEATMRERGEQPRRPAYREAPRGPRSETIAPEALNGSPPESATEWGDPVRSHEPIEPADRFPDDDPGPMEVR